MSMESIRDRILNIIEKQLPKINNAIIDVRYTSLGKSVGPIKIEKQGPYCSRGYDDVYVFLHIALNTDNQLIKDSCLELKEYDLKNGWDSILSRIEKLDHALERPHCGNMPYEVEAWYEGQWYEWMKSEEAKGLMHELNALQKKSDYLASNFESNNTVLKQIIKIALDEIRQVMAKNEKAIQRLILKEERRKKKAAEKFAKEEAKRPKVVPEGFDRPLSDIPARADDPRIKAVVNKKDKGFSIMKLLDKIIRFIKIFRWVLLGDSYLNKTTLNEEIYNSRTRQRFAKICRWLTIIVLGSWALILVGLAVYALIRYLFNI